MKWSALLCGVLLLSPPFASSQQSKPPAKKTPELPPLHTTVVVGAGVTEEEKKEFEKENKVKDALEKAKTLFNKGACKDALPQFLAVAAAARQMKDPRFFLSDALEHAATCHAFLKQWDQAETLLLQAAEHIREFAGPYESYRGHTFLNLAYLQIGQKKWSKAEEYCREAISVYDLGVERFGDEVGEIGRAISGSKSTALSVLGAILREQGRFNEALATWNTAYELGSSVETKPQRLVEIVNQAIGLLEWQGRTKEQEIWNARSAVVQEKVAEYVDPMIRSLLEAGSFLESKNQYDDALREWDEAYVTGSQKLVSKKWLGQVVARALLLLQKHDRKDELKKWKERERQLRATN